MDGDCVPTRQSKRIAIRRGKAMPSIIHGVTIETSGVGEGDSMAAHNRGADTSRQSNQTVDTVSEKQTSAIACSIGKEANELMTGVKHTERNLHVLGLPVEVSETISDTSQIDVDDRNTVRSMSVPLCSAEGTQGYNSNMSPEHNTEVRSTEISNQPEVVQVNATTPETNAILLQVAQCVSSLQSSQSHLHTELKSLSTRVDELHNNQARKSISYKNKKSKVSNPCKLLTRSDSSDDDTELDKDIDSSDEETPKISVRQSKFGSCKLPPFSGKEKWEVWFNRFEAVGNRRGWTEEDMLDELLPRLQGIAGEFVYGQLTDKTRSSYKRLTRELGNRFKQVEISKTYQAQFSKRNQKSNESVVEYANELKRLYDKGHSSRPSSIRQEDLLRRFLDGISDRKIAHQIEFVKEPKSLDEAVVEVVAYQEGSKRCRGNDNYDKKINMVKPAEDSDEEEGDECSDSERIARIPERNPAKTKTATSVNNSDMHNMQEQVKLLTEQQKAMLEQIKNLNKPDKNVQFPDHNKNLKPILKNFVGNTNQQAKRFDQRTNGPVYMQSRKTCFSCGLEGHFVRNCPNKFVCHPNNTWNYYNPNKLPQNYAYTPQSLPVVQAPAQPAFSTSTLNPQGGAHEIGGTPVQSSQGNY